MSGKNYNPQTVAPSRKSAAKANSTSRYVISNVGFYAMLVLDAVYIALISVGGFTASYMAVVCVLFSFEILATLFMLPVPLIQLGIRKKNVVYKILFALLPFVEIIWSIYMANYGGAGLVFGMFCLARWLLLIATFILYRWGAAGGAALVAAVAIVIAVASCSGAAIEFKLSARPIGYDYVEDTEYYKEGYSVANVCYGKYDNVRIPSVYKGKPVVSVSCYVPRAKNLDLPESVTYLNISGNSLERVIVRGEDVCIKELGCPKLKEIVFTSESGLPKVLPEFYYDAPVIKVHGSLLNEAMKSEAFADVIDNLEPIVSDGEGYVMYYTDFTQPNGSKLKMFDEESVITQGGGTVTLPQVDLSEKHCEFLGWYDSRDYKNRVTSVSAQACTKLYAKYYVLYNVCLFKDKDNPVLLDNLTYHYERGVTLPDVTDEKYQKDGYAFCGWYDYNSFYAPQKGEDIKRIEEGNTGDVFLYPVYKKLYKVTVHDNGADYYDEVPEYFHEWSDEFDLGDATKDGYSFIRWCIDEECNTQTLTVPAYDNGWQMIKRDLDLYLLFARNFSITYHLDGGTPASELPAYYHEYSYMIRLPNVSRTGYKFDGWYSDPDYRYGLNAIFQGSTGDKELYVKFDPITYVVMYLSNGAASGDVPMSEFTYDAVNTLSECAFNRIGYVFTGWEIDGEIYEPGAISKNFSSVQSSYVYASAQWAPLTYNMVYYPGEGEGEEFSEITTYDTTYTFPNCPFTREGYEFIGWKRDGSFVVYEAGSEIVSRLTYEANANVGFTAQWQAVNYTVRYTCDCGDESHEAYEENAVYDSPYRIAKNRFERTGYVFKGWNINGTVHAAEELLEENLSSTAGDVVIAVAQWEPVTYTLEYLVEGRVIDEVQCTYDVPFTLPDCTVTVAGKRFDGWDIQTQDSSNNVDILHYEVTGEEYNYNFSHSPYGVKMQAYANFVPYEYYIIYESGADDAKGNTPRSTFVYGSRDNVFAECGFTREGYVFKGWNMNNVIYKPGDSYNILPEYEYMEITVVAEWEKLL